MSNNPKNANSNPIGNLVSVVDEPNRKDETPETTHIDGESVILNERKGSILNKQF